MMIHLKRLPIYLTFAAFILVPFAYAQNVTCATRPAGDNTNACASTSFVQTAVKSGSGGITVGTTTITGGTSGRILYDNAGVVGEYTLSGLTANLPLIGNTTGIAQGTRSGNTTTFVTTTGTLTSGRCVEIDANGNFVQASAACGGSGGTPGGSNTQLQYNAAGSFGGITGATSDGTNVTLTSPRITTDIRPSSNDGASLGISGTAFADLFLASGGVINWNAGALTLTEGSGLTQSANTNSTTSYTLNNSSTGASAVSRFIAQTGTGNSFLTMQVHDNSGSPFAQIVGGSALSNLRVNIGGGVQASWDANGTTSTAFIPNGSTVPSIGMYLPGASTLGWAVSSVAEVQLTSSAFSPVTSNGSTLGTSTLGWGDLHLHANGTVNWSNGSVSIGHISADDSLRFASATGGYQFGNFIAPSTTDGAALGSTSLMWSDLFLASGGVINWNNGTYTLTQSSGDLVTSGTLSISNADTTISRSSAGVIAVEGVVQARTADIQDFTASGTWTKPANVKVCQVELVGGGGGAGGGARTASGNASSGGGGGGGGTYFRKSFQASALGATETVTIGAGGAGGAGSTSAGVAGSDGSQGSNTTFGSLMIAYGGGAGAGGQLAANSGGGAGGGLVNPGGNASGSTGGSGLSGGQAGQSGAGTFVQSAVTGAGGAGGTNGAAGSNSGGAAYSAAGGGSGGGVSTAPAAFGGGNGGRVLGETSSPAGGSAGNPGTTAPTPEALPGGGGGGGGSNAAGVGGAGGNGIRGGGGGGGGSAVGGNGGAGGNGGDGFIRVTCWF